MTGVGDAHARLNREHEEGRADEGQGVEGLLMLSLPMTLRRTCVLEVLQDCER